jgi:gamma-glutamyl hercynylcysteine S-oxide synthase
MHDLVVRDYGAEQMIGDVWEWTSSDFAPWPGFTPMIYRDYSVPFFGGDDKVLRGGSWAVAPSTIRPSFRNWDYPVRRQIFAGMRMAWDA